MNKYQHIRLFKKKLLEELDSFVRCHSEEEFFEYFYKQYEEFALKPMQQKYIDVLAGMEILIDHSHIKYSGGGAKQKMIEYAVKMHGEIVGQIGFRSRVDEVKLSKYLKEHKRIIAVQKHMSLCLSNDEQHIIIANEKIPISYNNKLTYPGRLARLLAVSPNRRVSEEDFVKDRGVDPDSINAHKVFADAKDKLNKLIRDNTSNRIKQFLTIDDRDGDVVILSD